MTVLNKLTVKRVNGLTENLYDLLTLINEDKDKISFYTLPSAQVSLTFPNSNNVEPTITHYVKMVDGTFLTVFETPMILLDLCERIEAVYPNELRVLYEFYDLETPSYGSKVVFSGKTRLEILSGYCLRVTVNTI